MSNTAKLFMNGRSQAVRLPVGFRFDTDVVYIRKDPVTGDVILSRKPDSWDGFFSLMAEIEVADNFMNNRDQDEIVEKELF